MSTTKFSAGPRQIRRDSAPLYTVTRRTAAGGREHLAYGSNGQPLLYELNQAMLAVAKVGWVS